MTKQKPNGKRGRPRRDLPDVKRPNAFALWLHDSEIDVESVAKLLNVTTSVVYGWRKGTRTPSLQMALRIAEISDGSVGAAAWKEA